MRSRIELSFALALAFPLGACSSPKAAPLPVVECNSAAPGTLQSFALGDIGVYVDNTDPQLDPVVADLSTYLAESWNAPAPSISRTAPDFTKKATLWLSTSAAAATAAGASITSGYSLTRTIEPTGGATLFIVYANDPTDLAYGAYAFLEQIGIRFFHPKEELVPRRNGPFLPASLSVQRAPLVRKRGLQIHTLHPIEYWNTFMQPGDANLADAKSFIDWLVKTGQNYVQWPLLSSVDFATWQPYARQIIDYAHSRGVSVGAVVQIWGQAALQNNYVLVSDEGTDNDAGGTGDWQAQIDSQTAQLMQLPWDVVELAMGEFIAADPQSLIDWLSYATNDLLTANPNVQVNAQNHVGNYPQLWVEYDGQTEFYYQLPKFADPRLGMSVHTLFFFDLYRDWAMYNHPNFHLQHDFILAELPTRRVNYFPESAYWVTADDSVPQFFPEYVLARWNDIHALPGEIDAGSLPALNGHVMFSSGHEWGYWMTDYLTAKMLWDPNATPDTLFADYANAYGNCGSDIASALSSFTNLQTTYLFDQQLAPYVMAENTLIDIAEQGGTPTVPPHVQFEDLAAMDAGARADFESSVVVPMESMANQITPLENSVAERCRGSDTELVPWCNELSDGMAIDNLRLQHTALLYRSILAYADGNKSQAAGYQAEAVAITSQAADVIARRESEYRFDASVLTGAYPNPTIYPYGYLHEAHTQCFWHRREQQVEYFLTWGRSIGLNAMSCD